MTLTSAIQNYTSLKTAYDAAYAENENIMQVLIPQAERTLTHAEEQRDIATQVLRKAGTAIEVKKARTALEAADETVLDLMQLNKNLKAKSNAFEVRRNQMAAEVKAARLGMWALKREELMLQLSLPREAYELLEKIIAAGVAAKDGYAPQAFAVPIGDKYGFMETDRLQVVTEELMTEMGAN